MKNGLNILIGTILLSTVSLSYANTEIDTGWCVYITNASINDEIYTFKGSPDHCVLSPNKAFTQTLLVKANQEGLKCIDGKTNYTSDSFGNGSCPTDRTRMGIQVTKEDLDGTITPIGSGKLVIWKKCWPSTNQAHVENKNGTVEWCRDHPGCGSTGITHIGLPHHHIQAWFTVTDGT